VRATHLDSLSDFLFRNFGYRTGPYEKYRLESPADRYLAKLDYNWGSHSKLSLVYHQLVSHSDSSPSNSGALGLGSRSGTTTALAFANSGYRAREHIRSGALELHTLLGRDRSNHLLLSFEHHDEGRGYAGGLFPMVDIVRGSEVYTSFGTEAFSAGDQLRYGGWRLRDDFSLRAGAHDLTVGIAIDWQRARRVSAAGSQSVYVYRSLNDFYDDANAYLADPDRRSSSVNLRRFQVLWPNVPGQSVPLQELEVLQAGAYVQDLWRVSDRLRLSAGLRLDRPGIDGNAVENPAVEQMLFRDERGIDVRYSTARLPSDRILISPRLGFSYDVAPDGSFRIRGGSGLFTGRPAYVWMSNQIAGNGVLTGGEELIHTFARPFHPDPNHYKPASVAGAPAGIYPLALTDPAFAFPQIWRTSLAVARRLPWGVVGTGEILYGRDVNGVRYINGNLRPPDTTFRGPDRRARWTTPNRVNASVTSAIILKNQDDGYHWNVAGTVEKPFAPGTFFRSGLSYGLARNHGDLASDAFDGWAGTAHAGNPNLPGVGLSRHSPGGRFFAAASVRRELVRQGPTTVSAVWESVSPGRRSYIFDGDMNGDGVANDLLYIPLDRSEMNFEAYSVAGRTFSVTQQTNAWDAYIRQDEYLSRHRGQYAGRNAVALPTWHRLDLAVIQEIAGRFLGLRNAIELRADILNVGNLVHDHWGVPRELVSNSPLIATGVDARGVPKYRLRATGSELISRTFRPSLTPRDLYQVQLSVRYRFD
jgi:hypothetical protein